MPHRVLEGMGVAGGREGRGGASLRGTVDEIERLRTQLVKTTAVRPLKSKPPSTFWPISIRRTIVANKKEHAVNRSVLVCGVLGFSHAVAVFFREEARGKVALTFASTERT